MIKLANIEVGNVSGGTQCKCMDSYIGDIPTMKTYGIVTAWKKGRKYKSPKWAGNLQSRDECMRKCCDEMGTTSWKYGTQDNKEC